MQTITRLIQLSLQRQKRKMKVLNNILETSRSKNILPLVGVLMLQRCKRPSVTQIFSPRLKQHCSFSCYLGLSKPANSDNDKAKMEKKGSVVVDRWSLESLLNTNQKIQLITKESKRSNHYNTQRQKHQSHSYIHPQVDTPEILYVVG